MAFEMASRVMSSAVGPQAAGHNDYVATGQGHFQHAAQTRLVVAYRSLVVEIYANLPELLSDPRRRLCRLCHPVESPYQKFTSSHETLLESVMAIFRT